MDSPVPRPEIGRALVEATARDIGVVPGDPAYPFMQSMLRLSDEQAAREDQTIAAVQKMLADAQTVASEEIARNAAALFPQKMDSIITRRMVQLNRAAMGIGVLALLAVGIMGFGLGWYVFRPYAALQCQDQPDGSRVCYMWTRPPTAPKGK
jgi:hypothetical protein